MFRFKKFNSHSSYDNDSGQNYCWDLSYRNLMDSRNTDSQSNPSEIQERLIVEIK